MAFLWHSHHIGNGKSSQLTNSIIFRGVGIPPTSSQETDHLGMISWWGSSFDDYLCESFIKGSLGVYTSVWWSLRAMKSTVIACDCKERALQVTVTAKNSRWRLDAKNSQCKEEALQGTVTAKNSHCKEETLFIFRLSLLLKASKSYFVLPWWEDRRSGQESWSRFWTRKELTWDDLRLRRAEMCWEELKIIEMGWKEIRWDEPRKTGV